MLCHQELLNLELFQTLSAERLNWVCQSASEIKLAAKEILVKQGEPGRGFLILISGQVGMTRLTEGIDMPIGQHRAPSFFGEIPVLTDEPTAVSI